MQEQADTALPVKDEREGMSLYVAIAFASSMAALLVIITFTMFVNSSALTTVKKIQANQQAADKSLADYDTTSPIKAVDIDETLKGIENTINKLDAQADYGSAPVTKEALGLPL